MQRQLHILLVEDTALAQMVAKTLLTHLGHSVDIAADGPQAVSMFENNQYDFIFMDIGLPVFDGIEATRRIRQLEQGTSHVPIVALTANYEDSNKKACLAIGMDDFLGLLFFVWALIRSNWLFIKEKFVTAYYHDGEQRIS